MTKLFSLSGHFGQFVTLAIALLALSFSREAKAQVDFKVDSTMNWIGFINVFNLPAPDDNGAYQTGFVSPTENLPAIFGGEQTVLGPSELVLGPNTNTYTENEDDPFWVDQDTGLGNKQIAAVMYVEPGDIVLGERVTFSGTVVSDTLASGYTVTAFIKVLNPGAGFSEVTRADVPITDATTSFNVELDLTSVTDTSLLPQFGFEVIGRNVSEQDAETTGTVVVAVENPDPLFTTQPEDRTVTAGTTVEFSVEAVGTSEVSFQWQKDGVDLANGGDISGARTANLSIANAAVADSGEYTVIAINEAGSTTSNIAELTVLNLQIFQEPADQRVPVGSTVVFFVEAASPFDLTYEWSSIIDGVTTVLTNGDDVSGVATDTLTLTNVQLEDSGAYEVTVSAGSDSTELSATLLVKTQEDYLNFLENPNFENDPTGIDESPWVRFQSSDPALGSFQDSNDTYFEGGNVNVFEGNYVSFTVFNADFSGIYQDVMAHPGQVFTASIHFYNASGDPVPEGNTAFLEVQFRNAENAVIRQYVSATLDSTTPRDTWMNFPANLAGDFGFDPPTEDADELIAPAGTASVRFQVTLVDTGEGALYYDAATLMLVDEIEEPGNPVIESITRVDDTVEINWTDPAAVLQESVTGVSGEYMDVPDATSPYPVDTAGKDSRFYRLKRD